VVGVLGHNGAGKSVLMKMLSGALQRDGGEIYINGEKATINNPRDARNYKIETIYQTLALADNLDAASNLFLGRELITPTGLRRRRPMEAETRKIMGRLNPNFRRFHTPVSGLVRRAAAIGGDRPRGLFQRQDPDHGRTDRGARRAGNADGRRTDRTAEVGRASASS
jgi:ABC-type sugar transport system ATPase subunit